MNMGATQTFRLPQGWTLRKVATTMARSWLPPFMAVPRVKGSPWMVQPIVEESGDGGAPLWEAGMSTADYEERLDRTGAWSIRAKAGRSKGTVLARLVLDGGEPGTFVLTCCQDPFPETLFDAEKVAQFLTEQGGDGPDSFFAGLLARNGVDPVSH